MYVLIKREILDHIVYFFGAIALSTLFVLISIPAILHYDPNEPEVYVIGIGIPAVIILVIGFCAMGVSQMYMDKNRKISTFLTTLPVSRNKILLARIITGTLAILIFFLPLIITASILLRLHAPPVPIYSGMIFEISAATFLMGFACYCIGLQTGWNSGRITPTLGGLSLSAILIPLIIIKGFSLEISVILAMFIIACLIRIRHTFISTPL
jgi:ABC-type transport system involved in multi-copper enzyme maturation permease subunit